MSKEMLELADEYACGLAKMEASGYEEWRSVIPKHKLIIAALRASAVAEPVAWRWRRKNDTGGFGEWHVTEARPNGEVYDLTPLAHLAPAAPVPASVREALMLFADPSAWRLGGSCDPNSGAFRGQEIAQRALASLPAPEAAPTREEPTAEAIREILLAHIFATRHYEIRGLDEAANAIIALKAAPAKANHVALGPDLDDGQRGKERVDNT